MAGNLGYFLQGMGEGLQSGINMSQQLQEMKWQKKQRKELEEKQVKIKESTSYISNLFKQYGADNTYTDDETMQLSTAIWASIPEVQAVYKDALNAIQTNNRKQFEEDLEWLDLFVSQAEGLDPSNVQGIFDTVKGWVRTEKGKNYFEAYENLYKKKYEAMGPQPTDISRELDITGKLPEEYKYPYLKEKGIVGEITPTEAPTKAPSMADEKSAIDLLRVFLNASPEQFEKQRTRIEQERGLDLSNYTQDILKESGSELFNLYATPEEVISNVKAPKGLTVVPSRDSKTGKYYATFQKEATTTAGGYRATSLDTQEKYKDKALYATTLEDKQKVEKTYTEAGYDPAGMPSDQDWIDAKLKELESHVEMLKEITDEEGKLMGSKKFNFMSGDEEETQTGEAWYKDIYEAYVFYLEELKKMGVDVSKYRKIKSPAELKKGFFGGYPSIY